MRPATASSHYLTRRGARFQEQSGHLPQRCNRNSDHATVATRFNVGCRAHDPPGLIEMLVRQTSAVDLEDARRLRGMDEGEPGFRCRWMRCSCDLRRWYGGVSASGVGIWVMGSPTCFSKMAYDIELTTASTTPYIRKSRRLAVTNLTDDGRPIPHLNVIDCIGQRLAPGNRSWSRRRYSDGSSSRSAVSTPQTIARSGLERADESGTPVAEACAVRGPRKGGATVEAARQGSRPLSPPGGRPRRAKANASRRADDGTDSGAPLEQSLGSALGIEVAPVQKRQKPCKGQEAA
jgi:hypothetical protein